MLFFGTPIAEPNGPFSSSPTRKAVHPSLSLDGLHLVTRYTSPGREITEYTRNQITDPFELDGGVRHFALDADYFPRLSDDKTRLFLSSGGDHLAHMHVRPSGGVFGSDAGNPPGVVVDPDPSAGNRAFGVTFAHGQPLAAYVVNTNGLLPRVATSSPVEPEDGGHVMLGTPVVHQCLVPQVKTEWDAPMWLSDDGLTLIFRANVGAGRGETDLYMAQRRTTADQFSTARKVVEISLPGFMESAFTMPSLAALEANGCVGDAWVLRTAHGTTGDVEYGSSSGAFDWFRVPVRVGSP